MIDIPPKILSRLKIIAIERGKTGYEIGEKEQKIFDTFANDHYNGFKNVR